MEGPQGPQVSVTEACILCYRTEGNVGLGKGIQVPSPELHLVSPSPCPSDQVFPLTCIGGPCPQRFPKVLQILSTESRGVYGRTVMFLASRGL